MNVVSIDLCSCIDEPAFNGCLADEKAQIEKWNDDSAENDCTQRTRTDNLFAAAIVCSTEGSNHKGQWQMCVIAPISALPHSNAFSRMMAVLCARPGPWRRRRPQSLLNHHKHGISCVFALFLWFGVCALQLKFCRRRTNSNAFSHRKYSIIF